MIAEVLPPDFHREEARWASTPGIAKAMRIMDDAEAMHAARQRERSHEADTRSALEAVGRALIESIAEGHLDESTIPEDLREPVRRARILMKGIEGGQD